MVEWIVNDLSVDSLSTRDFISELNALLNVRRELANVGHKISCAKDFRYRRVNQGQTVLEIVHELPIREKKFLALAWLTKGPFWNSPADGVAIVYFESEDVTDQGLGEAARRRCLGEDAQTFSFRGDPRFEVRALDVSFLREGSDCQKLLSVPNVFQLTSLLAEIEAPSVVSSWADMIDVACAKYTGLRIARAQIVAELSKYPFDRGAQTRLLQVLKYLNDFVIIREQYGEGSPQAAAWIQTYIASRSAIFSSEDTTNEDVFTFYDPDTGRKIFCPWHGKVHNPLQYRIHYEWPIPAGQRKMKVLYIGQKITKR